MFSRLAVLAALAAASPALAGSQVTHLWATLTATPSAFTGICPKLITFNGKITVAANFTAGDPVKIGYKFQRDDGAGADAPPTYLTVYKAGTYAVTNTWKRGGSGIATGWERIHYWVGEHPSGAFPEMQSNEAHYVLHCAKLTDPYR